MMGGSRDPFSVPASPWSHDRELRQFRQALADAVASEGIDSPIARAARQVLGRACILTGMHAESVTLLEENLAACERTLGAGHLDAAVARSDAAWARLAAGNSAQSLPGHERAIAELEQIARPEHRATIPLSRRRTRRLRPGGRWQRMNARTQHDLLGTTWRPRPARYRTSAAFARVLQVHNASEVLHSPRRSRSNPDHEMAEASSLELSHPAVAAALWTSIDHSTHR